MYFKEPFCFRGLLYEINVLLTLFLQMEVSIMNPVLFKSSYKGEITHMWSETKENRDKR